jgi:hypothetical protein
MEKNPLFDDIKLNNIDKNLSLIPEDIKKKIYNDHFKLIIQSRELCDLLLIELNSDKCINLDISDLFPLLSNVLINEYAIEYLYNNYYHYDESTKKKNNYFKKLYDKIIKNNNRNFILIDNPIEDFALSWLMYMYH